MEYKVYRDGESWCAVNADTFINIQESQIGFGDSPVAALDTLIGNVRNDEIIRCNTTIRNWRCSNCNKTFYRGKVKMGDKPECYYCKAGNQFVTEIRD